jgi:hypothetical protein
MSMHEDRLPVGASRTAERAMVAVIIIAGTICVGLITAYVTLFDGRGILN